MADTDKKINLMKIDNTYRRYEEGDHVYDDFSEQIFNEDKSHKCPTYIHKTPPCQGSCPSGEDIRGWLQIVRGIEKPPTDVSMSEYAFRRSTTANPFPSQMGRVCPAPCQTGCNRNEVDDYVGINAVEQYIGDTALKENYKFEEAPKLKKETVAIIGGGPAGLSAAFQLRKMGYASTIFEERSELGGMMKYGIPGYRTPRDLLDKEIQRILDLGDIEVVLNKRVGKDIELKDIEKSHDAVLWTIGCWNGKALPVDGGDAVNCISGVDFLEAFCDGRLKVGSKKVVCVGGGDTSIDVVSVARRLGHISSLKPQDKPESIVHGYVAQDVSETAMKVGADVTLTSLFKKEEMTAAEQEVNDAVHEGVTILNGVMPTKIEKDDKNRATAIYVADCKFEDNIPKPVDGTEKKIEADLIVSAIGQSPDIEGLEDLGNDKGFFEVDEFYRHKTKEGHFVAGDIIRPHLLTTAIGQGSIASQSIKSYFENKDFKRRPKVDVHHFNLLEKLRETDLQPDNYKPALENPDDQRGTDSSKAVVHNYEDRSSQEVIPHSELFLGHFKHEDRVKRGEAVPSGDDVIDHHEDRIIGLTEEDAIKEASRCMSCGMCFECDNCVIYCPQDAVFRVKKDSSTMGRYVDTDYDKCIGCHICADVCPTGYIKMGLGE
ncbi:MAG: glutamate synthase [Gammaproteobacteria bacterium]|nr:glutamate synthase [Gammaproteobacteria bacterium]|tara:strand:- start:62839 stop:64812 length:1974 start_codon:yes stop_codon:yes gene_type:complete